MSDAAPTAPATSVLAGCGDLGTEIGLRLAALGDTVFGVRRRVEVLPEQITGIAADLTGEIPTLPSTVHRLVVVLTADGRDADAYRETYLGGLRRTLDALDDAAARPDHAVLVSSTGVYGDREGDLDETTPPSPTRATHEVLLEAEALFHDRLPHGTVLRLSGLYGPGRGRFVERARQGQASPTWTNRIHRDDAAAAVVHLLTHDGANPALLLGTDDEPAPATAVANHIRVEFGLPPLEHAGPTTGRRLRNTALRDTGFELTFPTYREGYHAVLTGRGRRHP